MMSSRLAKRHARAVVTEEVEMPPPLVRSGLLVLQCEGDKGVGHVGFDTAISTCGDNDELL